ncbi:alpha/beta hydrolase-fold protein [Angustibacter aerolatus]
MLLGGASAVVGAAGGGYAAVERDLLPGRVRLDQALHRPDADLTPPVGPSGTTVTGSFASRARGTRVGWTLVAPPDVDERDLPLVVALHGARSTGAEYLLRNVAMPAFLAAHVRDGGRPFAVVAPDGGPDRYWHPRADGDDPLGMVLTELLPRMADRGLRTGRIGVMGWSMGGFGALSTARESAAGRTGDVRVVVAAASSPALFASAGGTSRGSFDSPADWRRWGDLVRDPGLHGLPVTVSCGSSDPFATTTRAYRSAVHPRPAGGLSAGYHTPGYWRSVLPAQLRFLGRHLT